MTEDYIINEQEKILTARPRWNFLIGIYYKSKDIQHFQHIIKKLIEQNDELKDYLIKIGKNPIMDGFAMESMSFSETETFCKKFEGREKVKSKFGWFIK